MAAKQKVALIFVKFDENLGYGVIEHWELTGQ